MYSDSYRKNTKTYDVLRHMEENVGITSMEAFELYGATRLSAIIFNLRGDGIPITAIDRVVRDRHDNIVHFAEYRIVKE